MSRVSVSALLAAVLAVGTSCNGSSGGTDGGGGTTSGTGGHAGGGGGDSLAGSGGHSSGGQGGAAGSGGASGGAAGSGASGGAGGAKACLPSGAACSSANECCSFICAGGCQSMIVSDRNMKRDFAAVNDGEILKAVDALPITSWSYKGDSSNARHIGPMAQDFMSTFHVGSNDKTILQVDGDGVSLAAIKALSQRLQDLEARNRALETQVSQLRVRLSRSRRPAEN